MLKSLITKTVFILVISLSILTVCLVHLYPRSIPFQDSNTTTAFSKLYADKFSVAYVAVPNIEVAKNLAYGVVKQKLAASVNIIPQITSIYAYTGDVKEDNELLLIIKTRTSYVSRLTEFVCSDHPYEVISLPVENWESTLSEVMSRVR